MYKLYNDFVQRRYNVVVVGCGGTGGFVAEGLCRILPTKATLVLVDHDVVEEPNLRRQNFYRTELRMYKSEALARRLSVRFNRPIAYSTLPLSQVSSSFDLIIGCVDNGLARAQIVDKSDGAFWIDAGNSYNYGQVAIGNTKHLHYLEQSFDPDKGICFYLPYPHIQMPELLRTISPDPSPPPCEQPNDMPSQSPVINQAIATLVLEFVFRLLQGQLTWMRCYIDLQVGTLTTVPIEPKTVSGIVGMNESKLMKRNMSNKPTKKIL